MPRLPMTCWLPLSPSRITRGQVSTGCLTDRKALHENRVHLDSAPCKRQGLGASVLRKMEPLPDGLSVEHQTHRPCVHHDPKDFAVHCQVQRDEGETGVETLRVGKWRDRSELNRLRTKVDRERHPSQKIQPNQPIEANPVRCRRVEDADCDIREPDLTQREFRDGGLVCVDFPSPCGDLSPDISVRRGKAAILSGCETHPATVAPAGSNRSSGGGNETVEAFGVERRLGRVAKVQAVTCSER